jgi:hypothetical protein
MGSRLYQRVLIFFSSLVATPRDDTVAAGAGGGVRGGRSATSRRCRRRYRRRGGRCRQRAVAVVGIATCHTFDRKRRHPIALFRRTDDFPIPAPPAAGAPPGAQVHTQERGE